MTIELASGLIGALLGSIASVSTIFIQQRFLARQERSKIILEAAIRQHQAAEEHAKFMAGHNKGRVVQVRDLAYYIALYSLLIEQLNKPESITESSWARAYERAHMLTRAAALQFERQERAERSE